MPERSYEALPLGFAVVRAAAVHGRRSHRGIGVALPSSDTRFEADGVGQIGSLKLVKHLGGRRRSRVQTIKPWAVHWKSLAAAARQARLGSPWGRVGPPAVDTNHGTNATRTTAQLPANPRLWRLTRGIIGNFLDAAW